MPGRLAVNGGQPVCETKRIRWPLADETEEQAALEVIRSGKWWFGEKVAEFERAYADFQDARFGITTTNGTTALETGCVALGLGAGDEVITSPYTFIATVAAPLRVNAVPVFVDIDVDTSNLDADLIEAAITPRTKAIIPVHFGGLPCDMDRVNAIAEQYGLRVLEDAAHCWGTKWNGKGAGALGDAGAFSFQTSKNMTAGEGGILLTDSEEVADDAASYRNCGRARDGGWYEHHILGNNHRMTELQAALLLCQLKRMRTHVERREENAAHLGERLRGIAGIHVPPRDPRVTVRSWHLYEFRLVAEEFGCPSRDGFLGALRAEGIPCGPGYDRPLYRNPMFLRAFEGKEGCPFSCPYRDAPAPDYRDLHLPRVEQLIAERVTLPHQLLLGTKQDMDDIADAVEKIHENAGELTP